ncbi:MAG: hypothetical protein SGPRY_007808 [Prymnesium sp.]
MREEWKDGGQRGEASESEDESIREGMASALETLRSIRGRVERQAGAEVGGGRGEEGHDGVRGLLGEVGAMERRVAAVCEQLEAKRVQVSCVYALRVCGSLELRVMLN